MEAVAAERHLKDSLAGNLGVWRTKLFRRTKALRLALLALGLSFTHSPAFAQTAQQLPPVRVRATTGELGRNGTWPDSLRRLIRDSLARGRERWERTRPPQYLLSAIVTWAMAVPTRADTIDGRLEAARVRGDSIVAIVHRPASQYTRQTPWLHLTVDRVFRHLEAQVASPTRQVDVLTLDSVWGFPRSWRTDDARNGYSDRFITEEVSGGAVVFFEPESARSCAWWRRWLHKCTPS